MAVKKKKKAVILVIIAVIVVILAILPFILGKVIYRANFNQRYTTYEPWLLNADMFDGLSCDECTFKSSEDIDLAGYKLYNSADHGSFGDAAKSAKAVVVIAHGFGGGGFNSYMNAAAWFAAHDYVVFGYDVTGNDNSGGECVDGLPRGIADLDYAINYVETQPETAELPVCLWGHSWGAFSVANVLNIHPEVKAAVSVSGWNRSDDMIYQQGKGMIGEAPMKFFLPFMMRAEKKMFGKYSGTSAIDGFKKTDAGIMIVHSSDDTTIPTEIGYDKYFAEFGDDPRFTFVRYEDRGHNYIYHSDDALEYIKQFIEQRKNDFNLTEDNTSVDPDEWAEYTRKNLDLMRYNEVDGELFDRIDRMYTEYCK